MYQKSWYDLQFLSYRAWRTEIGNRRSFFAFYPPKTPKNQFWKNEKLAGDIIILHMCTKKSQTYDARFLRYGVRCTEFFVILGYFLPFHPPPPPPPPQENQNFEKIKKALADVVLLHVCTLYEDQMMYGSWDIKHNEQNFLSFWAIFCPFTPLKTKKIFFWKNET